MNAVLFLLAIVTLQGLASSHEQPLIEAHEELHEEALVDGVPRNLYPIQSLAKPVLPNKLNMPWEGRHFLWRQGFFDPQSPEYWKFLSGIVWGSVAIALLTVVISTGFCVCRFCFNGCGGKSPKQEGYTLREQRSYVIALAIVAAFVMGGVIACLVGANLSDHHARQIFVNIEYSTHNITESINFVNNTFAEFNNGYNGNFTAMAESILGGLVFFEQKVFWANIARGSLGYVSFLCGTLCTGLAIASSISRRRALATGTAIIAFLSVFFMLITCGVHLSINVIADDACDAGDYINKTYNFSAVKMFDSIYHCSQSNLTQPFYEAYTISNTLLQQLNDTIDADPIFGGKSSLILNFTPPKFFIQNNSEVVSVFCGVRDSDWNALMEFMMQSNISALPQEINTAFQALNKSLISLSIISQMMHCYYVESFVQEFVNNDCEDFVSSLTLVWVGSAIAGVACFVGGFVAFNASKRFMRQNYLELEEFDDMEPAQTTFNSLQLFQWVTFDIYDEMRSRQNFLESFCIVQFLAGLAHLSFVEWEDENNYLSYALIAIVGGFIVVSVLGFILTKTRSKWGILLFTGVQLLLMIAFLLIVIGLSLNVGLCYNGKNNNSNNNNNNNDNDFVEGKINIKCPSLYHKSTYVIGEIVILVDLLFMLVNVGLAGRLFYIIHTGKAARTDTTRMQSQSQADMTDIFSEDEVVSSVV